MLEHTDTATMLDNDAIYDICRQRLKVKRPTYDNINRLIAKVVSSMTASLRFDGALLCDLTEFYTNLVPYPRINHLNTAFAPLMTQEMIGKETIRESDLTVAAFEPDSIMIKADPRHHKYMAAVLMFRGNISPGCKGVCSALSAIRTKRTIQFVDWCPTGFKSGVNYEPMAVTPDDDIGYCAKSLVAITNTTAISEPFERINRKFDAMFEKRAFVYRYVSEGIEESDLVEAREDLAELMKDYEEVAIETAEEEGEEQEME